MKRLAELLFVAVLMLLVPVIARTPILPASYVDPLGGAALAVQPDEMLPDPALEQRARRISGQLRCLVCQNQSIDDSDAALAHDLRVLVRDRLRAGDDDAAVVDYVVARYGEFVLLKPRVERSTILLWGTPFFLLLAGAAYVFLSRRRKNGREAANALTPEEERAVERLLARHDRDGGRPDEAGRAA